MLSSELIEIPIGISLAFVALALAVSVIASLAHPKDVAETAGERESAERQ